MAKYLLDSDFCNLAMKKQFEKSLKSVVETIASEGAAISVVTYGETLDGVLGRRGGQPALNRQRWERFLAPFDIVGIDVEVAEIWAGVRQYLRTGGMTTPDTDLLIASTALRFDLTMVTFNRRHFERVEGLSLVVPDRPVAAL